MPSGIKGYRWVETGCKVWQLEDTPRHFRGAVSITADPDSWSWWIRGGAVQGYSPTIREARAEVERRVCGRVS